MTPKSGRGETFTERGIRYLRNFHAAVGAAALAGSFIFAPLTLLAAYEGVNTVVHEETRRRVRLRRKK